MLAFRMIFKRLVFLQVAVLVVGCAEMKMTTENQADGELAEQSSATSPKGNNAEEAHNSGLQGMSDSAEGGKTEGQQGSEIKKLLPIASLEDPMKKIVPPLSLLEGYDKISNLLNQKKDEEAVVQLKELQSAYQDYSGPSYRLARIYQKQKKYDLAIDSVETSLSINPSNYYALNLKGVLLREKGEFEKAKEAYQKAINLFPSFPNSHLNLAILADIYLYDLELALEQYQIYSSLLKKEDKKVSGWLIDLKRRVSKGN